MQKHKGTISDDHLTMVNIIIIYYSVNLNYPLLTQQQPDDEIRPSHNKMHFPHDATHTEWSPPLAVSLSGLTGWWDSHEKM